MLKILLNECNFSQKWNHKVIHSQRSWLHLKLNYLKCFLDQFINFIQRLPTVIKVLSKDVIDSRFVNYKIECNHFIEELTNYLNLDLSFIPSLLLLLQIKVDLVEIVLANHLIFHYNIGPFLYLFWFQV